MQTGPRDEGLFVSMQSIATPADAAGSNMAYTPIIDTDLVFRYDSIASGPPSEP
jgi:hypothetical protein